MKLTGHAAVFNKFSVDLGDFIEVIAPGAFARTLRDKHPIFAIHHHNFADILGSTRSETLKLTEDSRGLYFELDVPDTSLGRDVHSLVGRGDLVHMSFSFQVNGAAGESWRELPSGLYERTLLDVDLFEVSTVALPAYKDSNVSARSLTDAKDRQATSKLPKEIANSMRAKLLRSQMKAKLSGLTLTP